MTETVKAPSAHDQTTDQVGTNEAIIHGYLYDFNKPQQGTISNQHFQLTERSVFLEMQLTVLPQISTSCCQRVNLFMLPHRNSYWVLLVHGALFCIIWRSPSESLHEGLFPSADVRLTADVA